MQCISNALLRKEAPPAKKRGGALAAQLLQSDFKKKSNFKGCGGTFPSRPFLLSGGSRTLPSATSSKTPKKAADAFAMHIERALAERSAPSEKTRRRTRGAAIAVRFQKKIQLQRLRRNFPLAAFFTFRRLARPSRRNFLENAILRIPGNAARRRPGAIGHRRRRTSKTHSQAVQ